jgi:hypothetical protein
VSTERAHDFNVLEPPIVDQDMTAADITYTLQHLHFRQNGLGALKIDKGVRDYLVAALRRKGWANANA